MFNSAADHSQSAEVRSNSVEVFDIEESLSRRKPMFFPCTFKTWTEQWNEQWLKQSGAIYYSELINGLRSRYFPIELDNPEFEESEKLQSRPKSVDIILRTCSHQTKLRIDCEHFQIIGYQMQTAANEGHFGQWLEFGHHHNWRREPFNENQRIPGSSSLGFSCCYISLIRAIKGGQTLEEFMFSPLYLVAAINALATSTNRQAQAWALVVVSVTICEAVRFRAISEYIFYVLSQNFPPLPLVEILVHRVLCKSSLIEERQVCKFWEGHCCGAYVLVEDSHRRCRRLTGLRYLELYKLREQGATIRSKRPGTTGDLMEVISVCVNSVRGRKKSTIFEVAVYIIDERYEMDDTGEMDETGGPPIKLYDDTQLICSGDNLLLTCPGACFPINMGYDGFRFVVFGKRTIETHISWNSFPSWYHLGNKYDKPLFDEFVSEDCSLILGFIVLKHAVQANVEVSVVRAAAAAHIYGEISSRSAKFMHDYEITVFRKSCREYVEVLPGKVLELSRPAVAVPHDTELILEVELYADDGESSFAQGTAKFSTAKFGSYTQNISGVCGEICVKVTLT